MTVARSTRWAPDDALGQAVLRRVALLQAGHLAGRPDAAGRLARLRRAVEAPPGSVADVWADTIGALPAELLGHGDDPSPYERAAHAALCLYAVHQQSQPTAMHIPGQDLGTAVQALRRRRGGGDVDDIDPVLRRFHTLATAASWAATTYHLRGLVALLRTERVGLDYGRLAVDLRRLQHETAAIGVRLAWGRSLYRQRGARKTSTTTDPAGPAGTDIAADPEGADA